MDNASGRRRAGVACGMAALLLGTTALPVAHAQGARGAPPANIFGQATFPDKQRPPGDPAVIARGQALFGINCKACHGADLRGGDLGGPNLLRSQIVLGDQAGEHAEHDEHDRFWHVEPVGDAATDDDHGGDRNP